MDPAATSAVGPSARRPAVAGWRLWRRWVAATTAGEVLGFAVPATAGALIYALDASSVLLYTALVVAGAVEGSLLAFAQSLVLRSAIDRFPVGRWVAYTALAAAFAWALGLVPSTLGDRVESIPLELLVPLAAILGLALLLSLGFAQWLVLRGLVAGARGWIPANAVAWTVGLALSVGLMSVLISEETSTAATVAIAVAAGLLMGFAVGGVTGAYRVRLLRPR